MHLSPSRTAHQFGRDMYCERCEEVIEGATRSRIGAIELWKRDWGGLLPPSAFKLAKPLAGIRKILAQLPLQRPWDPLRATSNLRFLSHLCSDPLPPWVDAPPKSPIIRPPSTIISTLSDFVVADTSNDESPADPVAITPCITYLKDGNAHALHGSTLLCVHTGILSLQFPALHQAFFKLAWHQQSHPTVVLVTRPPTLLWILPCFPR